MSDQYWRAKIWGLLHDPALKALHNNKGRGKEGFWESLQIMEGWVSPKETGRAIATADLITSASDRAAIGSLQRSIDYNNTGLEISHLLSGAKLKQWTLPEKEHNQLLGHKGEQRTQYLRNREQSLFPEFIRTETANYRKVFWWAWRCLPQAVCHQFKDDSLILMPAETRLPDGSIWSHLSLTAALAGAIEGYDQTRSKSHPHLAVFTFSPIQELIKASRKVRDFWAGSWILHYLSACVCWKLANIYGPDCFLYPSLYQQPLIDHWLIQQWPDFADQKNLGYLTLPKYNQLLTAGFPNVIMLILPEERVNAAMQCAKTTLIEKWRELGSRVFQTLQTSNGKPWMEGLQESSSTWEGWLNSQWQSYWTAVPIGAKTEKFKDTGILRNWDSDQHPWVEAQNQAYGLNPNSKKALFLKQELKFLRKTFGFKKPGVNVGSWWAAIFDQTRFALAAIKSARTWEVPTAFGPRSTVSGIGPVVHPDNYKNKQDWLTEGDSRQLWQQQAHLFDGIEELNATETVKRGLHKILPKVLGMDKEKVNAAYPDLTAGVAGYLKVHPEKHQHFSKACQAILEQFPEAKKVIQEMRGKWGIPWADTQPLSYHPRLLNAGWLVEDITDKPTQLRGEVQKAINKHYPANNPANWYVLAAGDGDGMSNWLKGEKMQPYSSYIPEPLLEYALQDSDNEIQQAFKEFITLDKRMGPSTHNALSRALLDFSNQLVPYLTEQRYAGRLIYSGGDDVLAYTNLWEWDNWLWDIRQCFRGDTDPQHYFKSEGDYWQWQGNPSIVTSRPLFTMGRNATISFGVVIAHHSVPLAIALENLWEAEEDAKNHHYISGCFLNSRQPNSTNKDAVQIRVIYGNGNLLKTTAKFDSFYQWQQLLTVNSDIEPSIFEQAANMWEQHPVPLQEAIKPWTIAFCDRREQLKDDLLKNFQTSLAQFLEHLWFTTSDKHLNEEVNNWLKLAAFTLRNRII